MTEIPQLEIINRGLPEDACEQATGIFKKGLEATRDRVLKDGHEARLAEQDKVTLERAERIIKEYFVCKLQNLGVDPNPRISSLPPVQYVTASEQGLRLGGLHIPFNIIRVVCDERKGDLLDAGKMVAHEISHALANRRMYVYWGETSEGKLQIERERAVVGIETPGSRKTRKAAGIENGLAIWDQVDCYKEIGTQLLNEALEQHRLGTGRYSIDKEIEALSRTNFGPIDSGNIEPFIDNETITIRIPIVGLTLYKLKVSTLNIGLLKNFRFIEELSKIVGHHRSTDINDRHEYPQEGRSFLDLHRFTTPEPALRVIVEIFGSREAKIIFNATDQADESLDTAMNVVKKKKDSLGIK